MAVGPGRAGSVDAALNQIAGLLESSPKAAAERASALLRDRPDHPLAVLYLGIARRLVGDLPGAIKVLGPLARHRPSWAPAHYELGVTLGAAGRSAEAMASLRRAVKLQVNIGDAWLLIADHSIALGDPAGADAAYANHLLVSSADPRLSAPLAAICENRMADAEAMLRRHLEQRPDDAPALRLLAEVAVRRRRYGDAEQLLRQSLALDPGVVAARHSLAVVLHEQDKTAAALEEVDRLLAVEPGNPAWLNLKANVLTRSGDIHRAIETFAAVLARHPDNARIWMAYGDALKTAGRQADAIAAYRRSSELAPGFGESWWSLSNLKTFRFLPEDLEVMRAQLARKGISNDDRLHFHFALGKAHEDSGDFAESFANYAEGNRLRRAALAYEAEATSAYVNRARSLLTTGFFTARAGWGSEARDPIFIVGLPRAGSTLIEQILASHSAVEGTMELPYVAEIADSLVRRAAPGTAAAYPEILASLRSEDLRGLGERYLRLARLQRKTGARFFVDKTPNNWMHVGLIHLMLPNARIVDARRHPLGCCFSCFKQHFARGQAFTYSLEEVGRYYRDYVALMAHFDAVLPGRVHRVFYERMVEDTETEVRRLLAFCDLPFEDACLRFHETERAVSTASSEQVRRPVYKEAVDQWRNYERWLEPLRQALGPVLDSYPAAPGAAVTADSRNG
jgi:tetratricopeptide (TPR) repeat protein